ncbi:MAG: glycerol-3-phosphate acyltransferase [Ruminococcaceae bacterium]|nr:glycerol-3-phosphate acyltransferase [Oscillospiraceae bacterium]
MKEYLLSSLIGYLLGSLSPSALLSKLKKKNLRDQGTRNLGATNTMLILGKGYGALVMLFDIAKAFAAVKLAQKLFPMLVWGGLIAGCSAVIGHIFPFYMKFKGGKGLAAYGGMILGLDPLLFLILLLIAIAAMLITNHAIAMTVSATILFPMFFAIRNGDLIAFLLVAAISALILSRHTGSILEAIRGEDTSVRAFIKGNKHQ